SLSRCLPARRNFQVMPSAHVSLGIAAAPRRPKDLDRPLPRGAWRERRFCARIAVIPWDGRELVEQHHRLAGGPLSCQWTVLIVTTLSTLLWIAIMLGLISLLS